jgi:thiamine transport system permease protein
MSQTRASAWLGLPAALFFAVFYLWPLIEITWLSFVPGPLSLGAGPLDALREPAARDALLFSFNQALLSTGLTLLIGLPLAWVFARYRFPGASLWRGLAMLPFVLPPLVVAAAFSALFGARGWLRSLWPALPDLTGTLGIILAAHVFYNISVVLRIVGAALQTRDPALEEAAAVDGAGRAQIVRWITLPLLLPSILAASSAVFLFTFTSFGVVLLLGGIGFATLEVEIYRQTTQLLRLDIATALALLQLALTLVLGTVAARYNTVTVQENSAVDLRHAPGPARAQLAVALTVVAVAMGIGLPLLALTARAVDWADGPLWRFFAALGVNSRNSFFFVPPLTAVGNSLGFALLTLCSAVLLGLPLAYALAPVSRTRRLFEAALLLPLGTSAATLGLGFFVTFDQPPFALRTTPWLLPIAHTLIALPLVVRVLLPALRGIDPLLREAASVEGAGGWRIFRDIDLPLLRPSLAAAAALAFATSLGEFGASILISRPDTPTITVAIFSYLGQPGALNYGQAMAMVVILLLVTALAGWLGDRAGARG